MVSGRDGDERNGEEGFGNENANPRVEIGTENNGERVNLVLGASDGLEAESENCGHQMEKQMVYDDEGEVNEKIGDQDGHYYDYPFPFRLHRKYLGHVLVPARDLYHHHVLSHGSHLSVLCDLFR